MKSLKKMLLATSSEGVAKGLARKARKERFQELNLQVRRANRLARARSR